jgi:hypothetical protein
MEYVIIIGIIIVIFLLWRNGRDERFMSSERFISSHPNDWLILVSDRISTVEVKDGRYIEFIPIIGWRYNHWSHKYGYLSPITPPIYQVKDKLDDSKGILEYFSYWIRDGREYEISSEWTSGNDFWSNLSEWVENGEKIISKKTNIPECLRTEYFNIINKTQSESLPNDNQDDPQS